MNDHAVSPLDFIAGRTGPRQPADAARVAGAPVHSVRFERPETGQRRD